MKKDIINATSQAKAVRAICADYVDHLANARYLELITEIKENETISQLVHMIGEALKKEESELERAIELQLIGQESNVYFDSYRYCMTKSREMKATVRCLMGW